MVPSMIISSKKFLTELAEPEQTLYENETVEFVDIIFVVDQREEPVELLDKFLRQFGFFT